MLEVIYQTWPQFKDLPEEKVIRWYETYKAQETIDNEKYYY